jgi:uncharacterized protein (DUF2062 family)
VTRRRPSRRRRWTRRLLRAVRPARFRHTFLHRVIGERLFDRHLWVPDRQSFANGLALGVFIAITPVVGVHMVLALLLGYALRVNLPAAVVASWTPAYVLYPALHALGMHFAGRPAVDEVTGLPRWLRSFMEHGQALWMGCLIVGAIAAGVTYLVAWNSWRWIGLISPFHRRAESLRKREEFRLHAVGVPPPPDATGDTDDDPPRAARNG